MIVDSKSDIEWKTTGPVSRLKGQTLSYVACQPPRPRAVLSVSVLVSLCVYVCLRLSVFGSLHVCVCLSLDSMRVSYMTDRQIDRSPHIRTRFGDRRTYRQTGRHTKRHTCTDRQLSTSKGPKIRRQTTTSNAQWQRRTGSETGRHTHKDSHRPIIHSV